MALSIDATAQTECQGIKDPVMTGKQVMSFVDFAQIVQQEGAAAALPVLVVQNMLDDIRRLCEPRILPISEQQTIFLSLLYLNQVPYESAQRFLAGLRKSVHCPVDIGFLERVRIVDLGSALLQRVGEGGIRAPKPQARPLPSYTQAARDFRIEGVILLKCVILADGTAANCQVTRPLGYGLDEAAVLTIQERWRFEPATRDGVPVPVQANIEVSFRLY
jgi:TonB family protein